jgi:hypothetical protein
MISSKGSSKVLFVDSTDSYIAIVTDSTVKPTLCVYDARPTNAVSQQKWCHPLAIEKIISMKVFKNSLDGEVTVACLMQVQGSYNLQFIDSVGQTTWNIKGNVTNFSITKQFGQFSANNIAIPYNYTQYRILVTLFNSNQVLIIGYYRNVGRNLSYVVDMKNTTSTQVKTSTFFSADTKMGTITSALLFGEMIRRPIYSTASVSFSPSQNMYLSVIIQLATGLSSVQIHPLPEFRNYIWKYSGDIDFSPVGVIPNKTQNVTVQLDLPLGSVVDQYARFIDVSENYNARTAYTNGSLNPMVVCEVYRRSIYWNGKWDFEKECEQLISNLGIKSEVDIFRSNSSEWTKYLVSITFLVNIL